MRELQDHIDRDLDRNLIVQFEARAWLGQLASERTHADATGAMPGAVHTETDTAGTAADGTALGGFGRGGGTRRVQTPTKSHMQPRATTPDPPRDVPTRR